MCVLTLKDRCVQEKGGGAYSVSSPSSAGAHTTLRTESMMSSLSVWNDHSSCSAVPPAAAAVASWGAANPTVATPRATRSSKTVLVRPIMLGMSEGAENALSLQIPNSVRTWRVCAGSQEHIHRHFRSSFPVRLHALFCSTAALLQSI